MGCLLLCECPTRRLKTSSDPILVWANDFGRDLDGSDHVPVDLDIFVCHIYGHLCYVTVSSKVRTLATWFVSQVNELNRVLC